MGRRRPRPLLLGLTLVVGALGAQRVAAAPPVSMRVLEGQVGAHGSAPDADGWRVHRRTAGVYRLVVPGAEIDLDVPEWDRAADVTIVPLGRGVVEIRFADGEQPVDASFSFVALIQE